MASSKIQDFFNRKFFEIPKYQRGFAWNKENIRDLFNDMREAEEVNSSHYIGTVVLSRTKKNDRLFYVVDGQQRITTITMIINLIIEKLSKADASYYKRFYTFIVFFIFVCVAIYQLLLLFLTFLMVMYYMLRRFK